MPRRHLLRLLTLNLHNHRKLLVVDGMTGFTGGMNIRAGHVLADHPKYPVQDVHFRLSGPVVGQLQDVFAGDWAFCDGETLAGETWFPALEPAGSTLARGIAEGPDLDIDAILNTILAALSVARDSVQIVTPYFLPPSPIVAALNVAAMRGVNVEIVLPRANNIKIALWASRAGYIDLLERGCRIYESAPPFDHTKIFIVDNLWSLIGSTNWDPRSLHLNFEFNVASFDRELAHRLGAIVRRRIATAEAVTLEKMRSRPLPIRLRDGVARVFTPAL
jgi:cardiolipin synthase